LLFVATPAVLPSICGPPPQVPTIAAEHVFIVNNTSIIQVLFSSGVRKPCHASSTKCAAMGAPDKWACLILCLLGCCLLGMPFSKRPVFSTALQDEVLSHRLGLIPLKVDPAALQYKTAEEVVFLLELLLYSSGACCTFAWNSQLKALSWIYAAWSVW
jgi:hypothetical protein